MSPFVCFSGGKKIIIIMDIGDSVYIKLEVKLNSCCGIIVIIIYYLQHTLIDTCATLNSIPKTHHHLPMHCILGCLLFYHLQINVTYKAPLFQGTVAVRQVAIPHPGTHSIASV